jgi:hypothetical protein
MLAAEKVHRGHAIVEWVIADLKNGPQAHLPCGSFGPTAPGWSAPRCRSTSLAPPALASAFHAKATTGTIRPAINVPPGSPAQPGG